MAMKQTGRKVYKSMQGKTVDMDLLRQRNELTPAVGNARVNARGDELGPGGKIVKKREDVMREYYQSTGKMEDEIPAKRTVEKDLTDDWEEPAPAKKTTTKTTTKSSSAEWVEDADGNFVQKGE